MSPSTRLRSLAHVALFCVPVQAATRLANLNWMSADLANHALIAEFSEKYGSGHDLEVSDMEFVSSRAALSGLTAKIFLTWS